MSDEEKNEQEVQPEAAEAASAGEPAAEESAVPAEDTGEPAADAAEEAPAAPPAAAEPTEELHPKERRRRERSRHRGEARPPRDAGQRAQERQEERERKATARRAWRARSREKSRASRGEVGPARTEPVAAGGRAVPRERQGIVTSSKADKTITVRIDVTRRHRAYKKIVRESSTLRAHDERNEAGEGDTVRVIESRPLSRTKRWRLVEVLERAR